MWLRWVSWISFVAGLYLIASPFIYGLTTNPGMMFVSMALGVVVLILAFLNWYGTVILKEDGFAWLSWANIVLGLFTIILPYAFGFNMGTTISYVITGIVIVVVAFFHWLGVMLTHPRAVRP